MSFICKIKRSFLRWLPRSNKSTKLDTKEYILYGFIYMKFKDIEKQFIMVMITVSFLREILAGR